MGQLHGSSTHVADESIAKGVQIAGDRVEGTKKRQHGTLQ